MIDDGLDYPNDIIKYVLQVVFRGYVFLWSFSKGMLVSRCEFKMTDRNEVKQMGEGFMNDFEIKDAILHNILFDVESQAKILSVC